MTILCQATLNWVEGATTIPQGSTFKLKLLIWKCCTSYRDEDMVYSPIKYRETEGIKERNRLFENRIPLANEQGT